MPSPLCYSRCLEFAVVALVAMPGFSSAQTSPFPASTSTVESTPAPSMGVRGAVDWYDDRWYIAPFVNSLGPDRSRNAQGYGLSPLLFNGRTSGSSGGLALGKSISPEWSVELRASGFGLVGMTWMRGITVVQEKTGSTSSTPGASALMPNGFFWIASVATAPMSFSLMSWLESV